MNYQIEENLENIGFKSQFKFKETHIELQTLSHEEIKKQLLEKVYPAIMGLNKEGLINSFHFLNHRDPSYRIDLRISSLDWGKNEQRITEILNKNSITTPLKNFELHVDRNTTIDRGGELIFCNILEQESKAVLTIFKHIQNLGGELYHYASYIAHYYCNQMAIREPFFIIDGITKWG